MNEQNIIGYRSKITPWEDITDCIAGDENKKIFEDICCSFLKGEVTLDNAVDKCVDQILYLSSKYNEKEE